MTGKKKTSKNSDANESSEFAAFDIDAEAFTRLLADQNSFAAEPRSQQQQGSLTLAGDRWVLRWRDVADENGHRRRRSRMIGTVTEFPTRAEAQVEADRLRPFLIEPAIAAGTSPLFAELCAGYVATALRDKARGTIRQFRSVIDNHLIPIFGSWRAHEINVPRIRAFMTAQLEAGAPRKTIKTRRDYLLSILGWAEAVGYAAHRPAASTVRVPRTRQPIVTRADRSWSDGEIDRLLAAAPQPLKAIVAVLAHAGLRAGECLALDWAHVDVPLTKDKPVLRVRASASSGVIGPPKTRASVRDVPIPSSLAQILEDYHRASSRPIGGLLFPGQAIERPVGYSAILKRLDRLCTRLGIERRGRGLHGFRYRYAQNLADANTPPKLILELCGWSDLSSAAPYLKASGVSTHEAVARSEAHRRRADLRPPAARSTACPEKSLSETASGESPSPENGSNVLALPKPGKKR